MEYDYEKIGKRIKGERKKRNWTQNDLLNKLKPYYPIGRNTLSDIENGSCGNISLNLFITLCKKDFFDCNMSYLLCENDERCNLQNTSQNTDLINITIDTKTIEKILSAVIQYNKSGE